LTKICAPGTSHAHQLIGHFVRVVRQRIDLILGQCLGKAVVAAIGGALVLDDHGLFDRRERQPQRSCFARRIERRCDGPEAVGQRLSPGRCRDSGSRRRRRRDLDRHGRFAPRASTIVTVAMTSRVGLIEDRDAQRRADARPLHHLPAATDVSCDDEGGDGQHS
jgi:hypothetical protein